MADTVEKRFLGADRATLIQEWHVPRNTDSRTNPPGFKSCGPARRRGLFQQHRPEADVYFCTAHVRFRGVKRREVSSDLFNHARAGVKNRAFGGADRLGCTGQGRGLSGTGSLEQRRYRSPA